MPVRARRLGGGGVATGGLQDSSGMNAGAWDILGRVCSPSTLLLLLLLGPQPARSWLSTGVLVVAEGVLMVPEPVEVLSTVFSSRLRFGGR